MESVRKLLEIMSTLRDPEQGCPWDREQSFSTIAPYTVEEAYEVADAIERNDRDDLLDELGDLLFQVVYHARMAEEEGSFAFSDVVDQLNTKLVHRHPHVFPDDNNTPGQRPNWEQLKRQERMANSALAGEPAVLSDVSPNLPALQRARKLQDRAAGVGFDWPSIEPVLDKIDEELREVRQTLAADTPLAEQREEIGDLLFACVNLARHLSINAESALRYANRKFERRFRFIETRLHAMGRDPASESLESLDALWEEAKRQER